jgi:hypothetical protein
MGLGRWLWWLWWLLVNKRAQTSRVANIPSFFYYLIFDDLYSDINMTLRSAAYFYYDNSHNFFTTLGTPQLHKCHVYYLEKYVVGVAFPRKNQNPLCQRCRNGQEPYLTYIRTSSRCVKCGVKNNLEQICEYCRNAQELPKIIRPLPPTVPLHEQSMDTLSSMFRMKQSNSRNKQSSKQLLKFLSLV